MSFFGWLTSFGSGKKKKRSSERLSEKAFIPSGGEATTPQIRRRNVSICSGFALAILTVIDQIFDHGRVGQGRGVA